MNATFITVNSKLTIDKNTIWEKRILEPTKNYWFLVFVFLIALLVFEVDEILKGRYYRLLFVLLLLTWMAPHITRIYRLLFVKVWRWYVPLSEIKDIHRNETYNELEETVTLILKSGRQKTYLFRKSEEQAQKFVELVAAQTHTTLHATAVV